MKKKAIFFPGVGYTSDRPLLYYARKILSKYGYEIIQIDYGNDEFKIEPETMNREKIIGFVSKAAENTELIMRKHDISKDDQVVMVGKSIGCVVAALYAVKHGINALQIMLTPLEYAFQLGERMEGIVFAGTNDKFADANKIKELCHGKGMQFYPFEACNHSLETGEIEQDIILVGKYAQLLEAYVSGLSRTVYDFSVKERSGRMLELSYYKGKVLLIVNTATGCGFTPQYNDLEQLFGKYKNRGFMVLDFPCNQFANQAPGSSNDIYSFCTSRYAISFAQFAKLEVNGEGQDELFKYLKERKGFEGFDLNTQDGRFLARKLAKECPGYEHTSDIKWNFTKFLVNQHGQVVARYEPTASFKEIETDIERLLGDN